MNSAVFLVEVFCDLKGLGVRNFRFDLIFEKGHDFFMLFRRSWSKFLIHI